MFYSCIVVVGVIGQGWLAYALRAKLLQFFGFISYALYMFHQTVNGVMFGFLRHSEPTMTSLSDASLACASAMVAIGLAYASTRWFETPSDDSATKSRTTSRLHLFDSLRLSRQEELQLLARTAEGWQGEERPSPRL